MRKRYRPRDIYTTVRHLAAVFRTVADRPPRIPALAPSNCGIEAFLARTSNNNITRPPHHRA